MAKKYKIRTGELVKITKGLLTNIRLIYAGMPNEKTFAIAPIISEAFLNQGFKFSTTIYYSIEDINIRVLDTAFKVIEVSSKHIILKPAK